MRYFSKPNYIKLFAMAAVMACFAANSFALTPETFATSSRLSSGKWAKVEVTEAGMQFISNATLKSLGFSDPDKVNVYGFGGRMLPEKLFDGMPDDLPILPSVKTAGGIVFFGQDCIGWEKVTSKSVYKHNLNPYSEHSYYFLSDSEPARRTAAERDGEHTASGSEITWFYARLLHEQDITAPTNTGRTLLGEDFRTQRKRNFQFSLPDNIGDAIATICFGATTTGGKSTIVVSANDTKLEATNSDVLADVGKNGLYSATTTIKEVKEPGDKLNLTIEYSHSGTLFMAALDYIEVVYPRQLRLSNDELSFFLDTQNGDVAVIENCGESTMIWDVTDPCSPVDISYTLSGSKASFVTESGYREYVAFNPAKITRKVTPAGRVANQDLHGMPTPDMVVITLDEYKAAAQKLANLHSATDGLNVAVVTANEVYNEFSSGTPDATAFRKMLKMWYDRGLASDTTYTRYCLLMGRPTYDNKMATPLVRNAGYQRLPIWQSTGSTTSTISKNSSYSTDDYIGMLADQPAPLSMGSANIQVAVGRMPVKSLAEANTAVDKLDKYLRKPNYGAWRNNVMLIADDQDGGQHLEQMETVYNAMRSRGNGENFVYEKLYLDSYKLSYDATGAIYPEAKQRMFDKLSEGVSYINYIGHGNPRSLTHESLMTWTDITSMTNTNLPFMYAATCEFMRWDDDEVSAAEVMWLNPAAGVIGMICPSREVVISSNGTLNKNISQYVYMRDSQGNPLTVGDIMINGKNDTSGDTNKLRYGLIGDPSLKVLSPIFSVELHSLKGVDTDSMEDFPVVAARSTFEISGTVTDADGMTLEDFNGVVEIQLFDAELAITTHGNGKDGKEMNYNDRKSRLYCGRARVTNGQWTASVSLPSEIENNYSPARIALYAFDDAGREANGSFEKFYVYGYDDNAPEDFDGPEFKDFYLNSSDFADGAPVSPSPILYANFSDASGINVSDAGIGHSMLITIDGNTYLNDVNLYYTPDTDDPLSGSIAYPLHDITPGDHTLKLTVWDNANNSSSKELTFFVSAAWRPEITRLATDVNPATTSVNFIVDTDGANGAMDCTIEVFDLNGKRLWSGETPSISSSATSVSLNWNLCDSYGRRLQRGIYIYRATVTTSEGATIVKSNKLAVAAQ